MSGALGITGGIDRRYGAVVAAATAEGPGDVGGDVAGRPAHLRILPRAGAGRHHGRRVGPSGGAGGALRQGGVASSSRSLLNGGQALRAPLEVPLVRVLKAHLVALLGEPVELGGQPGVAGHHGPDASDEEPDAAGRVRLAPLGGGEAGLAPLDGVGDGGEVEPDLPEVVFHGQHLAVRFGLLLGQLVLLGAQSQYLLPQTLLDLKDALAEAGDGGVEELARDGEHLLDLLGEQVGEDYVRAPAQSGAEGELHQKHEGLFRQELAVGGGRGAPRVDDNGCRNGCCGCCSVIAGRFGSIGLEDRGEGHPGGQLGGDGGGLTGHVLEGFAACQGVRAETHEGPLAQGRGQGSLGQHLRCRHGVAATEIRGGWSVPAAAVSFLESQERSMTAPPSPRTEPRRKRNGHEPSPEFQSQDVPEMRLLV